MAKIRIKPCTDHALILRLDRQIFPEDRPIDADDLSRSQWFVAWLGCDPVAFGGVRPCKASWSPAHVFLTRCGVLRAARGKGLQRRLLRVRLAWSRRQAGRTHAITYTMPSNAHSANNLIACGFRTYAGRCYGSDVVYWIRGL